MLKKCRKGRKLACYRNENIRFDVDFIAIGNGIE